MITLNYTLQISQKSNLYFLSNVRLQKQSRYLKKALRVTQKIYRSISLLPALSRIIEKTIHIQSQEYLDENGLLSK